jgi:ribosomal protein L35
MAGKQKTRKSMSKRFTLTNPKKGIGKVMRQKAAHNHRLVPKSKRAKGLAKMNHVVSPGDAKNIRRGIFV